MKKIKTSLLLINRIRSFIIKANSIISNRNILISFSGGQDSICLMVLFLQLARQFDLYFGLVYCNHLWTLNSLYKFPHILKIIFNISKNSFFAIATKKKFNEKNSRIWRYFTLYRISQFYSYKVVATGHTRTDQVETLLLNLFRSAGKNGVKVFLTNEFIMNKSTKKIFLSEEDLNV